ncbi:MAG: ATP-binding protein [Elusimicrobiota bacterium]
MPRARTKKIRPPAASEFAMTLAAWEGQFVEFKESVSDSLTRELVAFANSGGGRVYIGVTDAKTVKGIVIDNKLLSRVQDMARHCDPPVTVELIPFKHQKRDLLTVDVPEGVRKPYGCAAGYFLRSGPNTQKMSRDELLRFVRAQGDARFDETPCADFRYPADFSPRAFNQFLSEANVTRANLSREDLLVNIAAARRQGKSLRLNNAGVLFFAKKPRLFHIQSRITCLLFQGTDKARILDRKDFDGTIAENVDGAMTFLQRNLPLRYEITGLKRKEISAVPKAAAREALLNAVIHRDYFERGGTVMVELFRDRLEISNPGGLVPGLSLKTLGRRSLPRNPLIADLFMRLGEVEKAGTGIQRIRTAVAEARLKPPVFESDLFFSVTFALPLTPGHVPPGRLGASQGTKSALSRHQVRILDFCKHPRPLVEIMKLLRRSDRTKFREGVLGPLLTAGLIVPTIPEKPRSRLQRYRTTAAGATTLKKNSSDRTSRNP